MKWILRTNDLRTADIKGEIVKPTQKELLTAGLKKLGLFWMVALICLPFPGVHFVLVPFFFVYGIWSFFKVRKNQTLLKTGYYECPECKSTHQIQNLFINPGEKWRCNRCGMQTVIVNEP